MNDKFISGIYTLTQKEINRYANITGGIGKIHTDPEYAKTTQFKKTLVHGLYLVGLLEKEFMKATHPILDNWSTEVTFLKPVLVDQSFRFIFEKENENEWAATIFSNDETVLIGRIKKIEG